MRLLKLSLVLALIGCSDPYGDCVEREKAEYRQRNPTASYTQTISRQRDFEISCSKFKKG